MSNGLTEINPYGLTFKQTIFCEEYLKSGNVSKAIKLAFGRDTIGNNPLRSREVQTYLRDRMAEKMCTLQRITDALYNKIFDGMSNEDKWVKIESMKLATKLLEIEARLKEAEKEYEKGQDELKDASYTINIIESVKDT